MKAPEQSEIARQCRCNVLVVYTVSKHYVTEGLERVLTLKKRESPPAPAKATGEEARAEFREKLAQIPEETRACIDESGINKPLARERGRTLRGVKIEDVKSGRKFQRTNVTAARINGGIAAPLCYSGNTTSASFVEWFRTQFVKAAPKGTTVIMDNASFHPPKKLKNLCRRHGMRLLFLPAYSPDYNPIEKSWAKMKRALIDIIPTCEDVPAAVYQYFGVDIS